MSNATRAVWAQFELLLLQQGVLYIKSAGHTNQTKLKMVLPKYSVERALVEVHDGAAGAHLGRTKTLKEMKAKFWRHGKTKEVDCYCDRCLTCAKCKPRAKPRTPLQSFAFGNPVQSIHIDIVGPLPRSRREETATF